MIPKIAIQGHPTKGKEVIQILKGLGGKNDSKFRGTEDFWYYINPKGNIRNDYKFVFTRIGFKTYTLEEFEKEFPFKVGDKVIDYEEDIAIITGFAYIEENLGYSLQYENGRGTATPRILTLYKEMKEERNITLTLDKAKEWYKKGGELKEIVLQAYSEEELIKVELPKTWEEFCDNYPVREDEAMISSDGHVINCKGIEGKRNYDFKDIMPSRKSAEAHLALVQLEQLRDCYRQGNILDFTTAGYKYCIAKISKQITVIESTYTSYFLSFTKKEVAEEFLINFEPLIKLAEDYL